MLVGPILFLSLYLHSVSPPAQIIPDGTWRSNCSVGAERLQIYNRFQVHTEENFFTDLRCSQLNVRFTTIGQIEYPQALSPTYKHINFTYQKVLLTLFRSEPVADFNRRGVCGMSDWSPGAAKDITGLHCELFQPGSLTAVASAGDRRYGIYALSDGKLYYGKLNPSEDGSTSEKRPQQLNRSIEYTFQNSL